MLVLADAWCSAKYYSITLQQCSDTEKLRYLKKVWCSTAVFQSRLAILWLDSLNPIVLSKCSNCKHNARSLGH